MVNLHFSENTSTRLMIFFSEKSRQAELKEQIKEDEDKRFGTVRKAGAPEKQDKPMSMCCSLFPETKMA